jgi:hypothetical protein
MNIVFTYTQYAMHNTQILHNGGIEPPDTISLQLCTPKVFGE